jgi:hypothetical protein
VTKWDGAFRNIRRRSVDDVLSSLEVSHPFNFDIVNDESDVPPYLEDNWEYISGDPSGLLPLPGRDLNFVRDILISSAKFFHVVGCARAQMTRGATTWAIVDAYHASLIGARLIAALFGVLSYGAKRRTVLVDYRPELGAPDDRRAFRREAKGLLQPVRVLCPQPKFLQQTDVWALVARVCAISKLDTEDPVDSRLLAELGRLVGEPISAFRNTMIYDSVAWAWTDDLTPTPAGPALQQARLIDTEGAHALTLDVLSIIFEFCKRHISRMGSSIGFDPSPLSPMFSLGESPDTLLGSAKAPSAHY